MSDYRRAYVPGGSYFFTVVTERRAPIFRTETARTILGSAIRHCRRKWPFRLDALVLLDEHCHAIWTLPAGDTRYSARWGFINKTGRVRCAYLSREQRCGRPIMTRFFAVLCTRGLGTFPIVWVVGVFG